MSIDIEQVIEEEKDDDVEVEDADSIIYNDREITVNEFREKFGLYIYKKVNVAIFREISDIKKICKNKDIEFKFADYIAKKLWWNSRIDNVSRLIYDTKSQSFYHYNDKYFEKIEGSDIIINLIIKYCNLNVALTITEEKNIIFALKQIVNVSDINRISNKTKHLVVCRNCIVNINTMQTEEHNIKYFKTTFADANYDLNAKSPKFDDFLSKMFIKTANSELFQECVYMFLACLIENNSLMRQFVFDFHAIAGGSGKTTMLKIAEMIYHDLVIFKSKKSLSSQFGKDKYHNKILVCYDELSSLNDIEADDLKSTSAGIKIDTDIKFKDSKNINFDGYIALTSNKDFTFSDSEKAFYRRFIVFNCNNSYIVDKYAYRDLMNTIENIEIDAIFTKSVQYIKYIDFYSNEYFNNIKAEEIVKQNNMYDLFFEYNLIKSENNYIDIEVLLHKFMMYIQKEKIAITYDLETLTTKQLITRLKSYCKCKNIEIRQDRRRKNKEMHQIVHGLRFNIDFDIDESERTDDED